MYFDPNSFAAYWSEFFYFIFKYYKPSLVKLPIHLVGENGSFIRFWTISTWYPPAKKGDNYCAIIMTSPNVIGFATGNSLHCEDMAQGGIKHSEKYCVADGPNKVSWKITSYTPGTSMHRFPEDESLRRLWTQFARSLYQPNTLLSVPPTFSQLASSESYL